MLIVESRECCSLDVYLEKVKHVSNAKLCMSSILSLGFDDYGLCCFVCCVHVDGPRLGTLSK